MTAKDIKTQYSQIRSHLGVGHIWINAQGSASIYPSTPYLNGLYIYRYPSNPGAFQAWAVGSQGTILYSEDNGQTWQQQNSPTLQFLNSVVFADQMDVSRKALGWAVGSAFNNPGTIICTKDSGRQWLLSSVPRSWFSEEKSFVDQLTECQKCLKDRVGHKGHGVPDNPERPMCAQDCWRQQREYCCQAKLAASEHLNAIAYVHVPAPQLPPCPYCPLFRQGAANSDTPGSGQGDSPVSHDPVSPERSQQPLPAVTPKFVLSVPPELRPYILTASPSWAEIVEAATTKYQLWAVGSGFATGQPAIWKGQGSFASRCEETWDLQQIKNWPDTNSEPIPENIKSENCHEPVHLNAIALYPTPNGYDGGVEGYAVGSHLTLIRIKSTPQMLSEQKATM